MQENLGLAYSITHLFVSPEECEDTEVFSDAMFGLIRAAQCWIPEKGFKFSTYAWSAIRKNIIQGIEARCRTRPATGTEIVFEKTADHRRNPYEEKLELRRHKQMLKRLLMGLPDRLRQALQYRFLQGLTLKETGKRMGVSRTRVEQYKKAALRFMKKAHPIAFKRYRKYLYDH